MPPTSTVSTYRYDHFQLRHVVSDMRFAPDSPRPGDRLPDLDLETLRGERLTIDDLDRPHLFVFGSNTCPMTRSAGGVLDQLHEEFGDAVRFVLVQVREAHPGEHLPQPSTFAAKKQLAARLRESLGVDFTVAVDDVDGSFHRSLDPKPNAAYLVGTDGTILFRSIWSSDTARMRAALQAATGGGVPRQRQSTRMLRPMLGSIGFIDGVLRDAGPRASRDLARSAPPMLLGGRLAGLFRGVAPERRGAALVGSMVLVLAVVAAVVAATA